MKKIMFGMGLMGFSAAAFAGGLGDLMGAVSSVISSPIGVGLLGSMLLKKPASAPAAAPKPVMPMADDQAVQDAKRRQIAEIQSRSGRASTVLSDPGAKLGG